MKEDTFRNCTLEPKSLDLPTVWGMGDSHAGHLQAMLVSLHEQTGVGVHLIETPGSHFPPAGRKSIPRETILKEVESRMRFGDVFLLSRLYLDRDGEGVVEDLNLWVREVQDVAKKLEEKGVSVVVVGPPPMFNFVFKSTCAGFFLSDDKCSMPRERVKRPIESSVLSCDAS